MYVRRRLQTEEEKYISIYKFGDTLNLYIHEHNEDKKLIPTVCGIFVRSDSSSVYSNYFNGKSLYSFNKINSDTLKNEFFVTIRAQHDYASEPVYLLTVGKCAYWLLSEYTYKVYMPDTPSVVQVKLLTNGKDNLILSEGTVNNTTGAIEFINETTIGPLKQNPIDTTRTVELYNLGGRKNKLVYNDKNIFFKWSLKRKWNKTYIKGESLLWHNREIASTPDSIKIPLEVYKSCK
jgi:hypothetical protein